MIEGFFGLIGVIIGAFLSLSIETWRDLRARKRDASYLAIRIITKLDRFVWGCLEVAQDDGTSPSYWQYPEEEVRTTQVDAPELNFESLDVDWKVLTPQLLYEVLDLPNSVAKAKRKIAEEGESLANSAPDYAEYFFERRIQFIELGLSADRISNRLRDFYDLPSRPDGEKISSTELKNIQSEIIGRFRSYRSVGDL